jgi:hypothetical protein
MNVFCYGAWLAQLDGQVAAGQLLRLHLYQNDYFPDVADTIANYTEATFSGYTGSQLLAWSPAFINGVNAGEIDAAVLSWSHNGGSTANTVYGIYVTDSAGNLTYAERFPAPLLVSSIGDTIAYSARTTVIDQ